MAATPPVKGVGVILDGDEIVSDIEGTEVLIPIVVEEAVDTLGIDD